MESHTRQLSVAAQSIAGSSGSPESKFRRLTQEFLRLYEKAKAKHIVLLNELDALDEERRALIIAQEDGVVRLISALIGDILGGERRRHADLTVFSMLFLGMINWTYTWFDPAKGLASDEIADMAATLFIGGLKSGDFPALHSADHRRAIQ